MNPKEPSKMNLGPDGMPDWRTLYDKMPIENMPWFNPNIDPDLSHALAQRKIKGGRFLDQGAGPGTQAIELAKLGFDATGSDISPTAIQKATERALGTKASFIVDDILATQITDEFDYVFDRGCFHCFEASSHPAYLQSLDRLLKKGGTLFLKCFSKREVGTAGPKRYDEADLRRIFGERFTIESVKDTVYYGNLGKGSPLDHEPQSLFAVMTKK